MAGLNWLTVVVQIYQRFWKYTYHLNFPGGVFKKDHILYYNNPRKTTVFGVINIGWTQMGGVEGRRNNTHSVNNIICHGWSVQERASTLSGWAYLNWPITPSFFTTIGILSNDSRSSHCLAPHRCCFHYTWSHDHEQYFSKAGWFLSYY